MASLLPLGIGLQLLSCFLAALGYVLQKSAHLQNAALPAPRPLWRSPRWLCGLLSMVVSAGCAVGSAPLVPQSMQGPLGAVTIVCNCGLAALVLGEKLTVLDAISTAVIIGGTVLAVASNESAAVQLTLAQTVALLADTVVYIYTALAAAAIVIGGAFVERTSLRPVAAWTPAQRRAFSLVAPALGGLAMGYTGYTSKVTATVVLTGDADALRTPVFYAYCAGTLVAVVLQVRWLNKGLAAFSALAIVPVFQSAIILSNALAGIVYFHDMRDSEPYRLALFAVGALTCVGGVGLLLLKQPKSSGSTAATAGGQQAAAAATAKYAALAFPSSPSPEAASAPAAAPTALLPGSLEATGTRYEDDVDEAAAAASPAASSSSRRTRVDGMMSRGGEAAEISPSSVAGRPLVAPLLWYERELAEVLRGWWATLRGVPQRKKAGGAGAAAGAEGGELGRASSSETAGIVRNPLQQQAVELCAADSSSDAAAATLYPAGSPAALQRVTSQR